jgi:hypothetical protein
MTRGISCLILCAGAAFTASAEDMKWTDLCGAAQTRELTIITKAGVKARGTCSSQSSDSITLTTIHVGMIFRSDIKSVRLDEGHRSHTTANVLNTAGDLGEAGAISFVTPLFFLGPPILAAAVGVLASAPFCRLFDWLSSPGSHKITII